MKLTRILSPTDFSNFSGFAMEWAAYLAQVTGADLTLLHVVSEEEGKITQEIMGDGAVAHVSTGIRQNVLEERKRKVTEQFKSGIDDHLRRSIRKVDEMVRVGVPFLEIIRTAKERDVDMIVMGTHGRTGLSHALIGSVAERVVHHAHCPVLTIKHPQYKFIAPL